MSYELQRNGHLMTEESEVVSFRRAKRFHKNASGPLIISNLILSVQMAPIITDNFQLMLLGFSDSIIVGFKLDQRYRRLITDRNYSDSEFLNDKGG